MILKVDKEINMADNFDRAEINNKLAEKHSIKNPCEVFGRGHEAEVEDCKDCKKDCEEYATTCSQLTKGTYSGGKKGGKSGEGSRGDLVLESNSDKKDSETLTKKRSNKMSTATKKKPVVKKKVVKKAIAKDSKKFKGWREGSSADIIHQAVLDSGKKGLTSHELSKKVKGKFETSNLMGRIKTILTAAVKLDLLKKNDGVYSKK